MALSPDRMIYHCARLVSLAGKYGHEHGHEFERALDDFEQEVRDDVLAGQSSNNTEVYKSIAQDLQSVADKTREQIHRWSGEMVSGTGCEPPKTGVVVSENDPQLAFAIELCELAGRHKIKIVEFGIEFLSGGKSSGVVKPKPTEAC